VLDSSELTAITIAQIVAIVAILGGPIFNFISRQSEIKFQVKEDFRNYLRSVSALSNSENMNDYDVEVVINKIINKNKKTTTKLTRGNISVEKIYENQIIKDGIQAIKIKYGWIYYIFVERRLRKFILHVAKDIERRHS
jgi:hypothetical protein